MKDILGLQTPVLGLAPMDGVTDHAYRYITKKYGNPDIIFTEFTHVQGLCIAGQNLLKAFEYDQTQRPIVAQIYGKEPEYFYHAAKIVCALGFDGVDINMGCPAKNVTSSGAGAGLIRTPELAKEIIASVKEGVKHWVDNGELTGLSNKTHEAVIEMIRKLKSSSEPDAKGEQAYAKGQAAYGSSGLKENPNLKGYLNLTSDKRSEIPVSVKTRIGFDKPVTESWISHLDSCNPAWLTVHGRTLKQMYTGNADWTELKKAVESTDKAVLVNGDIKEYSDIQKVLNLTGAYGVLIGRATFGNPWVFKEDNAAQTSESGSINSDLLKKKIQVMLEHTKLFVENNLDARAFVQMRKHFGWYIRGFDGAKEIREKLMRSNSLAEVEEIVKDVK